MTKLTNIINLKAALVGAAVLTALSGFIASPAQAFTFSWAGFPNTFMYDFTIDTDNPANPVQNLTITIDPNTGNTGSATNLSPLSLQVTNFSGNRSDLDRLFDEINDIAGSTDPDDDVINGNDIFSYSITLDRDLQNLTEFNSIGFVVPTNFVIDDNPAVDNDGTIIQFDASQFTDPISGLNAIANSSSLAATTNFVHFPVLADGNLLTPQGEGFRITSVVPPDVDPPETTPEASSSISLLALGLVGLFVGLKRK